MKSILKVMLLGAAFTPVIVQVTLHSYKYKYCKLYKDILGFNIINTQAVHSTQTLRQSTHIYTFDDDQGIQSLGDSKSWG